MDNDKKFISKWNHIHKKGMVKYLIIEPLIILLILCFLTSVLCWNYKPVDKDTLYYLIANTTICFLVIIVARIQKWFKGEERYKKIINKEKYSGDN